MTVLNAVKKVVKTINVNPIIKNGMYSFTYNGQILSFFKNGSYDEITCIKTRRIGDESDAMSDYHAGCFHENITQALKFINREY